MFGSTGEVRCWRRYRGHARVPVPASLAHLLSGFTLPLGGSAALAAGEGPLRALRPDSPGGRVIHVVNSYKIKTEKLHDLLAGVKGASGTCVDTYAHLGECSVNMLVRRLPTRHQFRPQLRTSI